MDLTKIDQPFGSLDIETKLALHRAHYEGKVIEYIYHSQGKWHVTDFPKWLPEFTYRIQPEPLRDISLPWAALDDRWQWAARDETGEVWVHEELPDMGASFWRSSGIYLEVTDLFANFDPGNKPWSESLIRRPIMVEVPK